MVEPDKGINMLLALLFFWILYSGFKDVFKPSTPMPPYIDRETQKLISYKNKYENLLTDEQIRKINLEILEKIKNRKHSFFESFYESPVKYFLIYILLILIVGIMFSNYF